MTKLLSAFLALSAFALSASAAGIVVGAPADVGTGNCFPFGCTSGDRYQQMYSASAFSGPISINSITFYNTAYSPGTIVEGTYIFRLSTSPLTVLTIDTTSFAANVGADEALFALAFLSGPAYPSFTVSGTSFAYDPSKGDLLMDITASYSGSGSVFLDSRNNGSGTGIVSRYHNYGCCFEGWGLVTGFNVGGAVPEPATVALIPAGLAGLMYLRRRRASR